jgi:hypothetical protein
MLPALLAKACSMRHASPRPTKVAGMRELRRIEGLNASWVGHDDGHAGHARLAEDLEVEAVDVEHVTAAKVTNEVPPAGPAQDAVRRRLRLAPVERRPRDDRDLDSCR